MGGLYLLLDDAIAAVERGFIVIGNDAATVAGGVIHRALVHEELLPVLVRPLVDVLH